MPLRPVQPGQPITDKWANELPQSIIDHLLEYALTSDGSILFNRLGKGRLSLSARDAAIGAAIGMFRAIPIGGGAGTSRLRVKMGTINDFDEDSSLTVLGQTGSPPDGWWEFSLPVNSTRYGVADVTLGIDGIATAAKFSLYATAPLTGAGDPDTGAPPPHAYRKLFKVVTDSNARSVIEYNITGAEQAVVNISDFACTSMTKGVYWLP